MMSTGQTFNFSVLPKLEVNIPTLSSILAPLVNGDYKVGARILDTNNNEIACLQSGVLTVNA